MKKWQKILTLGALLTIMGGFLGVMITCGVVLYLSPQLPDVETLRDIKLQTPLRIYSSDGLLMAEFGEKRRQPVQFEQIPPLFIKALLAAEDTRFYDHPGVDPKGLTRAVVELISTGRKRSGGSTITMQVARNFFLTRKQTFMRKFNEILLALQIERILTKEEILALYVNKIYLGHRSYGIGAAAQVYYGRPLSELTLAELAMIAGLPKAPSRFNPISNPERAKLRRDWILGRMQILDFIDNDQFETATAAPISATLHGQQQGIDEPYIAEMARQELLDTYGSNIYEDGFSVTTTIDSRLQRAAQESTPCFRGAESHLSAAQLTQLAQQPPEKRPAFAIKALDEFYAIGPLLPAVVIDTQAQYALAMLNTGEYVQIPIENMAWARRHLSVNSLGPKIQTPSDVLHVGDIIRVTRTTPSQTAATQTAPTQTNPTQTMPAVTVSDPVSTNPPIEATLVRLAQVPRVQAALVSLDPNTGKLLALVGGLDFRLSKFNRAVQASRQVGSNIKPFVYAAALEQGFTAASLINDAPLVFKDKHLESVWRPENSGGRFNGPTRLRQALYQSRNLVSIRLLREIGVEAAIDSLVRFGFDREKLPRNLSLALGSAALLPRDVAAHYAVLANGGYRIEPYLINEIRDAGNKVIFRTQALTVCPDCAAKTRTASVEPLMPDEHRTDENGGTTAQLSEPPALLPAPRVLDEQLWYIIRSMLGDVIEYGTGRRAKVLGRKDLAGKTGTTNDQKDAWFSGFHRDLVTTVWVGFDEPKTLGANEYGGTAALPIWIDFMRTALANKPERRPEAPPGLITVLIDPETGKRARPGQSNAIFEVFRTENAPSNNPWPTHDTARHNETDTTLDEIF
ncbi:MAG: penicillin-binding protein 1A [Gammaproteobacteria bacterium]